MTSPIEFLAAPGLDPLFWPNLRINRPSAWHGHVPFAHWLVAAMRPRQVVELGTHTGVSFVAFCQAVQRLGLDTRCTAIDTWEGDAHAGAYDDEVYLELAALITPRFAGIATLRRCLFDDARDDFADGSIDLLHIDGYHTYEAVRHDFETWRPKLSDQGVVLFHDIAVHERDFGVWRFWNEVTAGRPHFAFAHASGLGVLAVGAHVSAEVAALCAATPDMATRVRARFAALGEAQEQARAASAAAELAMPDAPPADLPHGERTAEIENLFVAERFEAPPQLSTLLLPRNAVARGAAGCAIWIVSPDGHDWRHGILHVRDFGGAVRIAFPGFANAGAQRFHLFVTNPIPAPEALPALLVEKLRGRWVPILLGTAHIPVCLPNRPPRAVHLLKGNALVADNREPTPEA